MIGKLRLASGVQVTNDAPVPSMTTRSSNRGFTLTELIVTLVVIGILAVFLAPKLGGMTVVRQRTEYDKVLSAIAYARKAAIGKRRYACVSVSSTVVTLTIDPNPPELIQRRG